MTAINDIYQLSVDFASDTLIETDSELRTKSIVRANRTAKVYFKVGIVMDIASIILLGLAGTIAIFTCIASVNATPTTMPALP